MDINTIARENTKTLMHQKKISVNDLVEKYNVCKSTMYKHLKGDLNISLDKLEMIKDALNVSFSLILSKQFYNINKDTTTDYHSLYTNGRYYSHLRSPKEIYERNKTIYYHRVISDEKKTLQELGTMFNISRERVRQIQKEIWQRKLDKQTREANESTN